MLAEFGNGADDSYAEINEAALPEFYSWFRERLFDLGITRWSPRYDCDDFANLYVDLLQLRFSLSGYNSRNVPAAQALAAARYHYRPKCGQVGHAIVAMATQNGLRFLEPQTGAFVNVAPDEILTRFRVIF